MLVYNNQEKVVMLQKMMNLFIWPHSRLQKHPPSLQLKLSISDVKCCGKFASCWNRSGAITAADCCIFTFVRIWSFLRISDWMLLICLKQCWGCSQGHSCQCAHLRTYTHTVHTNRQTCACTNTSNIHPSTYTATKTPVSQRGWERHFKHPLTHCKHTSIHTPTEDCRFLVSDVRGH